ncbi:MAG: glycosyl hydrolase family 65 protein [Dehalococcoidia bacterium]|nr:glycosyl hydrolase family 65 protein [Dehalococcoidia bacterium]
MTPNGSWSFIYEDFQPAQERLREALCTLGNGYFATRGAGEESDADDVHYPGTYVAGGYNRLTSHVQGREIENEDLVNFPNWLPLTFRIDGGGWFDLRNVELLDYRQELDLKQGLLIRRITFRDAQGRRTSLAGRRFVHMKNPHLAGIELTVTAEDWSGRIEFRSALDGRIVNAGVERYRQLNNRHLEPLEAGTAGADAVWLKVRTSQSRLEVALAARTRLFANSDSIDVDRSTVQERDYVAQQFSVDIAQGSDVTVEKIVSLYTSRDRAIAECGLQARAEIERAAGFDELLHAHRLAWEHLWERCDLHVSDAERTTLILRVHMFHLLQTVSPNSIDLDVGVPARGWHGEAYRGHIFWDELFIFPFLNYRLPELTRALLRYRHRRLPEARANARQAGFRGAMYPWQAGSSGREESQRLHLNPRSGRWVLDNSHLQRHISAAIAYNVWQYYEITRDSEFLAVYGAEMILEIARFWASIATYNEGLDRYEILGVVGPDEYHDAYPGADHPGLDNNSYTNVMAAWVLCRALDVIDLLPAERRQELCETLQVEDEEIERWQDVSRKMRVVFHDDGIISQFEGYEGLAEFDWELHTEKYGDIHRLDRILEAEGDSVNRYKASKQADVLMLFYLFSGEELRDLFERLGYPFEHETIPKNVHYYLRRTSHGSTLSRLVHSWVLARSDRPASWRLFTEALESDIEDVQGGTTPEGIHLGAMAGSVDLMQRGYTGLEVREDILWFDPSLPEEAKSLSARLRYRAHWLDVNVTSRRLVVAMPKTVPGPIRLGFKEQLVELRPGEKKEFTLSAEPD